LPCRTKLQYSVTYKEAINIYTDNPGLDAEPDTSPAVTAVGPLRVYLPHIEIMYLIAERSILLHDRLAMQPVTCNPSQLSAERVAKWTADGN
jgi:hypothetical protein